jgi:predicted GNAT superfamily acetyltransferase
MRRAFRFRRTVSLEGDCPKGAVDRLRRVEGSAWALANDAASAAGVRLRPLTSLDDADAILRVMMVTWGEAIPRETVRALAGSGNVPWGAHDGDELIGYVLGWAAISPDDGLHEHSHMLAALPDRRHAGVGYALKLAQRASCLDRGIHLVRWTFDPLVARNAHLNVNKLGATCDRFHRDYYGQMPDSINTGDRSDRLVVRWTLDAIPAAPPIPDGARVILRSTGSVDAPVPEVVGDPHRGEVVAAQIPRDHAAVRAADPALGSAWREAAAVTLDACMAADLTVVAFEPDREGGRPTYLFASEPTP